MRQDTKLALVMLLPTVTIVLGIVLFPFFVNFWISFKSITLSDLRPPKVFVNEVLRGNPVKPGDEVEIHYRLRNSSQDKSIQSVILRDGIPPGLQFIDLDRRCSVSESQLECRLGDWEPKQRDTLKLPAVVDAAYFQNKSNVKKSKAVTEGDAEFSLTSWDFSFDNYVHVYEADDFWYKFKVTFLYTFFGTAGALILGLFAAQLLNAPFRGRALLRGFLLFPYVSPVIAVAFTWVYFLDPFSGFLNALFSHYGLIDSPINFLGTERLPVRFFGWGFDFPLALTTVTMFEIWRYFPLAFLFILARMQAMPAEIFEAARVDGASPFQQFFYIALPQLIEIISVLFLLRFIWTFNKFDDIYLMTGGASGTTTLTVDVYKQAFDLTDLGAGSAMAVIIFLILAVFAFFHIKFSSHHESL